MSSPPKASPSKSSVHQKLSLLTSSSSQQSSSKPFMKGKSQTTTSLHFPSFRFSPESEEIEEIIENQPDTTTTEITSTTDGAAAASTDHTDPPEQPSSSSGGDISPLKEYILKHKWANKWDKRSLSLDLDLKGKIITAIEDKRRSFVSHFYNEDDEDESSSTQQQQQQPLITSSHSIPDQLTNTSLGVGSGGDDDMEDLSVHSDSALVNHGNSRIKRSTFNFDEENCSDYYYEFSDQSPVVLEPDDLRDLVVEEIGVEADEDNMMEDTSLLKEFVLSPSNLTESFAGLPTLYQPPSIVKGLRRYPIQRVASDPQEDDSQHSQQLDTMAHKKTDKPVSFRTMIRRTVYDVVYNPWVRYWVGLLAVLVAFDFGRLFGNFLWFLLGSGGTLLFWNVLGGEDHHEPETCVDPDDHLTVVQMDKARKDENLHVQAEENYWRSQGWLLTLPHQGGSSPPSEKEQSAYPSYDAFNFHLRSTRVIFVRLNGPNLIVSIPHVKHRVPKRRLWNDPPINTDHIFVRHQQYNLYGAKVEIVPQGLAKKRVWCKKYPIAITLATKDKYCGKLLNLNQDKSQHHQSPEDGDNRTVSFKDGNVKLGEDYKGEVYKEEGSCAGRTLYFFARTDREKDDWFRRFVAASKIHSTWAVSAPSPTYGHFLNYMRKACPNLQIPQQGSSRQTPPSPRSTPTNELFDTVTLKNIAVGGSPASSRKTTPEKELKSAGGLFTPAFLNALVARLFYDFLQSPKWTHEVKQLIDRKLFFIRKPAFVQSLKVKELDLGGSLPYINSVSTPVLDRQGLWIDLDMSYGGTMVITLEAFVNFLKMGSGKDVERDLEQSNVQRKASGVKSTKSHAMFDSDADDSGESSDESDEDVELEDDVVKNTTDPTPKTVSSVDNRGKLLKYADTFAKSKVMQNKHVQKVVTGIAATPFMLTVEIKRVVGSMALNIPPVPNDRVWIGFRSNPIIEINVRPKVGERVVSLSQVTGWIKKKILLEFQRVMVCPNMMDVTVPLMEFELPK